MFLYKRQLKAAFRKNLGQGNRQPFNAFVGNDGPTQPSTVRSRKRFSKLGQIAERVYCIFTLKLERYKTIGRFTLTCSFWNTSRQYCTIPCTELRSIEFTT